MTRTLVAVREDSHCSGGGEIHGNSGMMDDISLRGSPKEYRRKHLSGVDNTWYLDEETWG